MARGYPDYSLHMRPFWYDRNPESKVDEYDASVGPHSTTERISYTVPAGKKAMVEVLSANAARTGAATTSRWVNVRWFVTPTGGAKKRIFTMNFKNNTAGDPAAKIERTMGSALTLFAGDKLTMSTTDDSTGGTISYECGYKLTEFDE